VKNKKKMKEQRIPKSWDIEMLDSGENTERPYSRQQDAARKGRADLRLEKTEAIAKEIICGASGIKSPKSAEQKAHEKAMRE
jgi:hypothetical protein